MNYLKIYFDLMESAEKYNRTKNQGVYYEEHHKIPRAIGGTDAKENLVLLTYREHFIAHLLLARSFPDVSELVYAANLFRTIGKIKICSRIAEYLKMKFIEHYTANHPTKRKDVIEKMSNSMKRRWDEGRFDHLIKKTVVVECRCGCENKFLVYDNEPLEEQQKFFSRECYIRYRIEHPDEYPISGNLISISIKNYLDSLTNEEMSARMKKSVQTCDHKKRGEAISKGKKGKKTNQQMIMGIRYANMTDIEFNEWLTGRGKMATLRAINLRNKWKNTLQLQNF